MVRFIIRLYTPTPNNLEDVLFIDAFKNANINYIFSVKDHIPYSQNDMELLVSKCLKLKGKFSCNFDMERDINTIIEIRNYVDPKYVSIR